MNKELEVIVASQNPVKINSARSAFEAMFTDHTFNVRGVSAASNVPDQPMSDEETLLGATNRTNNAKKAVPDADFWVGIEGGVQRNTEGEMEAFAWVVVVSRDGQLGKGKTGSFFLPQKMADLIIAGNEMGTADDIVFNTTNSKQSNGTVGNLTGNVITRTSYYEPAVVMALIPFKNPNLY